MNFLKQEDDQDLPDIIMLIWTKSHLTSLQKKKSLKEIRKA